MSQKAYPMSRVQTLAATFIFAELEQAHNAYQRQESIAKERFSEVLKDLLILPEHAGDAQFKANPDGTGVLTVEVPEPEVDKSILHSDSPFGMLPKPEDN